jgi:phospholipid/cholesterol/gamma-HCH transport system substrate-binding protein
VYDAGVRWISRIVSIVIIAVVVIGAFELLRAKMPATHVGGHFRVFARFRDGSRLAVGSPVMIAGVRVGEVSTLTVEGTFARVDMVLRDETKVPVDSWITKKAESAFGDSYLEIIPTGGEQGAASTRLLKDGEQITHVIEGGSTDTALRAIARTMPKIDRGLDAVHDFALSTRKWANGPFQDALVGADRWLAEGRIEKPIAAADHAMERLESGTTRAADAVASAKPDVDKTFDRIDNGIASARRQMKDLKSGIHDGLENAREGMDRVDPTIQDMADYMAAIDQGRGDDFKGRLGRLVNDPEPANTIADVTESAREAAANLDPFRSWLGFRGEWNVFSGVPRVYVTAELRARNDKFYLLELEKDGMGGLPEDSLHDIVDAQQYNRYTQISEQIRFTAQFGKRFGPLQLRGGLKESTFGAGADLLLNRGALRFSADVFGGFDYTPRVKLAAALEVFKQFYILGGVDDILNGPHNLPIETGNTPVPTYFNQLRYGRDFFVGGMMQFTDADLATIVRIYGALIVSML